jgi:hypothetical protein
MFFKGRRGKERERERINRLTFCVFLRRKGREREREREALASLLQASLK